MSINSLHERLPFDRFATENFRPHEQFDAWRDSISVVFDIDRPPETARLGFQAEVNAYQLGSVVLSKVKFDSQQFARSRRRAAADGLDHYLIQLYATGGLTGMADNRDRVLNAGDVQILDLSRTNETRANASGTIALVVPRDLLRESLGAPVDMHGLVLQGDRGAGGLLSDYMRSLFSRAGSIVASDATSIAHGSADIIAACFRGTADTITRAHAPLEAVLLDRLKKHVEEQLENSSLSVQSICRTFRISRSRLYRLFEPLGGISRYIQRKRLARAHVDLANPSKAYRPIYDIAYGAGFGSEAHFSRAFRSMFGCSPSDVRRELKKGSSSRSTSAGRAALPTYGDWIRRA